MSLNAKTAAGGAKGKRTPLEAGTYPARLVQVIDLGLQAQRPYQGQDKPPANMILLTYEFVDEFMKDEEGKDLTDKPRWISESFVLHNLAAEKATSTARYKALDPTLVHEGDFGALLDTPCMVTIVLNPNKKDPSSPWENIKAVAVMRDKDARKCPPLVNEPKLFNLDSPSLETFQSLAPWVQDRIKENLEFKGSKLATLLGDKSEAAPKKEEKPEESDDRPF